MSREIKFRAWWDKLGVMCVPNYGFTVAITLEGEMRTEDKTYTNEKYILMQFTGLKDNNGVDIYEGDIVKYKDESTTSQTGVVKNYGYMKIYIEAFDGDDEGNQDIELHQDYEYKVIGNIYENPELLI